VIRAMFRLAVIVSVFTIASLANTALSWHLPLPDLLPNTAPTPPCVLPGSPGGPPSSTTAYGQPAGFGAVIPDLPSAMGKVQGELLHKLNGPPPSQAQMHAFGSAVGRGAARWASSFRSAVRGQKDPASVTAYQQQKAAAFAAQNATSCNPCNPRADGSPDPSRQAGYSTAATRLDAEQAGYAARIVAVGRSMRVPDRGLVVAVAAAQQESTLRNLDHGDRDSVGLFQQRAGWGSVAERMNPEVAARKFYTALERVPAWQAMTVTQAAQAVQRSAYPNAYARWEALAAAAVGGQPAAGGMECAALTTTYKTGAGKPWGGYQNGRVPLMALAHPAQAPTAWFRPDAAAAFDRLSAAYAARFGHPLRVTDSYRDYAHQVSTKATKGYLAAKPGTSNHGWGLAADVVVGGYGSADYQWLLHNAPAYGWSNPGWAQAGGSKPEPWHYEFTPPGAAA
jgi:hypothetical protein